LYEKAFDGDMIVDECRIAAVNVSSPFERLYNIDKLINCDIIEISG